MSDQEENHAGPPPGTPVRALDPESVGKHFDAAAAEDRWDGVWQEEGLYRLSLIHISEPTRPY